MLASAQNEMLYGIYQGTGTLKGVGTQKAETYDVAMYLSDPTLAGLEIRGINVPLNSSIQELTNCKVWLTKELTLEGSNVVPDIASVDFTPDGKWAEVTFETPYVMTEEGIYAGYSITVPSVDTSNDSDPAMSPIMCINSSNTEGLFLHTSRTFRKWKAIDECLTNLRLSSPVAFAMVVRVGGDRIKQRAAKISGPEEMEAYALTGKSKAFNLRLSNHGITDIKNIEYEVEVGGNVTTKTVSKSLKGTYYGQNTSLSVTIPAQETAGSRPVTLRVTKVNGEDNEDLEPATTFNMAFLSEMPKHKPLMEEYTGTWCGWCPRGMAAMEALTKKYGDDFVGIAYHNGDPMTITNNTPNQPDGYPHAYVDRVIDTDPFFGTSNSSLGIEKDWKSRQSLFTPATLELEAAYTDGNMTAIEVTSHTQFILATDNNPLQLSYVLLADDLHSTSSKWNQANYYNSSPSSDTYLKWWSQQAAQIRDLHFNDVAIQMSNLSNTAIEGSLPQKVTDEAPYVHTYTFDVQGNNLIQNPEKLRVVAVLLNTMTGEVINAEKCPVQLPTGVQAVRNAAERVSYTDMSGRRVSSLGQGIYIKTIHRADGTTQSNKLIRY